MKIIAIALTLALSLVSVRAGQGIEIPAGQEDGVAAAFNDQSPMPESLDWLQSPGALKAHVLINLVRSGSVRLNGNFIQLDDNAGVRFYGESASQILAGLSGMSYSLSMPDKSASVNVFCELFDSTGYGRAQSSGVAIPVRQSDGKYTVSGHFELEMQDVQPIDFPGVTEAVISNDYGTGQAYGTRLPVWNNGRVGIPLSALENPGYLMLARNEPVEGGGTRRVSYGYQLGTGLSVHMIDVTGKTTFSIKNYWEKDDEGMPLFMAGQSVPLYLDMSVRAPEPDVFGRNPSQPAARIKITTTGRVLAIRIGCFQTAGNLIERGHGLRIRNMSTGQSYSLNPDTNGVATVLLPPGTYGAWYTVNALGVQRG